jgi:hypothetical protein
MGIDVCPGFLFIMANGHDSTYVIPVPLALAESIEHQERANSGYRVRFEISSRLASFIVASYK